MPVMKKLALNIISVFIDLLKGLFGLRSFTPSERGGVIKGWTPLKFIPRSTVVVPFALGRTIRGVGFQGGILSDPFYEFAAMCANSGFDYSQTQSFMMREYERESRLTSADIVGFPSNAILRNFPAWALPMPWDKLSAADRFSQYGHKFVENRTKHGAQFSDKMEIASYIYSCENAKSQINQTRALWKKISVNGVLPIRPFPGIYILLSGDSWRWIMSDDGNHRAYLSFISGEEFLRASLRGTIKRSEVSLWPNVLNGLFSPSEALDLFDSFFNGDRVRRGLT